MLKINLNVPLTDNLKKITSEWNKLSDLNISVFNIEEAKQKPELESYYNDLGFTFLNYLTGEIEIYISDIYPEAHIIHETLHHILRAEGYCETKVLLRANVFLPDYIRGIVDLFKSAIINHMDHLIINTRIHDYNLNFNKICKNEYSQMKNNLITLQNKEYESRKINV